MKLIGFFAIISVASAGMQQNPLFRGVNKLLNSVGLKDKELGQFKTAFGKQARKAVNSAIEIAEQHGVEVDKNKLNKINKELVPSLVENVNAYSNTVAESFEAGKKQADVMIEKPEFINNKQMIKQATFEDVSEKLGNKISKRVENIQNSEIKKVLNNLNNLANVAKDQMKNNGLEGSIFEVAQEYSESGLENMDLNQGKKALKGALRKATRKLQRMNSQD